MIAKDRPDLGHHTLLGGAPSDLEGLYGLDDAVGVDIICTAEVGKLTLGEIPLQAALFQLQPQRLQSAVGVEPLELQREREPPHRRRVDLPGAVRHPDDLVGVTVEEVVYPALVGLALKEEGPRSVQELIGLVDEDHGAVPVGEVQRRVYRLLPEIEVVVLGDPDGEQFLAVEFREALREGCLPCPGRAVEEDVVATGALHEFMHYRQFILRQSEVPGFKRDIVVPGKELAGEVASPEARQVLGAPAGQII